MSQALNETCPGCGKAIPQKLPGWPIRYAKRIVKELGIWVLLLMLNLPLLYDLKIPYWYLLLAVLVALAGTFHSRGEKREESIACDTHRRVTDEVDIQGSSTACLTESEVEVRYGSTRMFRHWRAYSGISLAGNYVLLFSERMAQPIPVAAFENEEALRGFMKFASIKIEEHASPGGACSLEVTRPT